jgi:hypothetical protein
VRPYGPTIRTRVFEAMRRAGCTIDAEDIIPEGTRDAEALRHVLASPNPVLLVPFHGHRVQGAQVDGLTFLQRLIETASDFRWRVVMPISPFASAALTFRLQDAEQPIPDAVWERLLILKPTELDAPGLSERLRNHLAGGQLVPPAS